LDAALSVVVNTDQYISSVWKVQAHYTQDLKQSRTKNIFFSRTYRVMNKILLKQHLFTVYYLLTHTLIRAETEC